MRKRLRDTRFIKDAEHWVSLSVSIAVVALLVFSTASYFASGGLPPENGAAAGEQGAVEPTDHNPRAADTQELAPRLSIPNPEQLAGVIHLHVAQDKTPVYSAPTDTGDRIATLSVYTDVLAVESSPDARWVKVILEDGREGHVAAVYLAGGMGLDAYTYQCRAAGVMRPKHGEVLVGKLDGAHDLKVPRIDDRDAVISLEDADAGRALSVYIRSGEPLVITGIPDGSFVVDYLQGLEYSPVCGVFTTDPQLKQVPRRLELDGAPGVVSLNLRHDPR